MTDCIGVILLAAGGGRRFGGPVPKQYVQVRGRSLLSHALAHLAAEPRIRYVQPVIASGDTRFREAGRGDWPFELLPPVVGGPSRAHSMRNGLRALPAAATLVGVHDAARPTPSPRLLAAVMDRALAMGAAVPGVPVSDTIKRIDASGRVIETPPRAMLRAVQTPQVARRDWLEQAVAKLADGLDAFSDDAALLEAAGFPVWVSEGEATNRKITTRDDLRWLEMHLEEEGA
ncbi:MAG: 2-C-methyl-D-erythritol 4-phosphate cytidylyltransferase [Mariprofundaceae bacterium]